MKKDNKEIGFFNPAYFEQNKQEIEKLKQFRSNIIPKISESWLQKMKVKKYKDLFQEFIQKIDALNIEYEEKNLFLEHLEKVFLLYEEEILIDEEKKNNLNNFYGEILENSLIFYEEEQKFENLVKELDALTIEAEKQQKLVAEKIKEKHNEDLNKNEKVVALTKETNLLTQELNKIATDLDKIKQNFVNSSKFSAELDEKILNLKNTQDKNDYISFKASCENSMNDLKKLYLDPIKTKKFFNIWLHYKFVANKAIFEEKNLILDGKIENYSNEIRSIKAKTNKIESEINEMNSKILKSKIILKNLSFELEEKKKIYTDLRCENLVLQQSENKIDREKENKQNLDELYKKAQEMNHKKQSVDQLKNELFSLKNQDNNDYVTMNQQISEEIKYLKNKIVDMEVEKINNKSLNQKSSRLNKILFFLFYLVSCVMIFFIFCDIMKKFCLFK